MLQVTIVLHQRLLQLTHPGFEDDVLTFIVVFAHLDTLPKDYMLVKGVVNYG